MEKRLFVQLNGNRRVIGILRGYDVCIMHGWRPEDFSLSLPHPQLYSLSICSTGKKNRETERMNSMDNKADRIYVSV
jgi:hypothetical protein